MTAKTIKKRAFNSERQRDLAIGRIRDGQLIHRAIGAYMRGRDTAIIKHNEIPSAANSICYGNRNHTYVVIGNTGCELLAAYRLEPRGKLEKTELRQLSAWTKADMVNVIREAA